MLSVTTVLPNLDFHLQTQHPNSNLRIYLQYQTFGFDFKTLGIYFRFKMVRILVLFTKYVALSNNEICFLFHKSSYNMGSTR